jgi:hypothetical protein
LAWGRADPGRALGRFQELSVTWGMGFALNNLALAAYQRNEPKQALALAEESVRLFRSLGVGMSLAETLATLGCIAGATGAVARARAVLSEALALAWAKGPRVVVAVDLEEAAALAAAQGRAQRAARLYGAAAALRAAMGAPLPPYLRAAHDRTVAAVRAALGDAFAAAWAAGEALPLEQAIDEALAAIRLPGKGDQLRTTDRSGAAGLDRPTSIPRADASHDKAR